MVATAFLHRASLGPQLATPIAVVAVLILVAASAAGLVGVASAVLAMGLFLAALVAVNVVALQRAEAAIERSRAS